jgi:hypothetical protein
MLDGLCSLQLVLERYVRSSLKVCQNYTAYSKHGITEKCVESFKRKAWLEEITWNGKIILKQFLKEQDVKMRAGLSGIGLGPLGRLV